MDLEPRVEPGHKQKHGVAFKGEDVRILRRTSLLLRHILVDPPEDV